MAITGAIFNSLIYGGVDSADYGVYITGDAVFNAPKRSVELVSVPGRNGAIEIDQGHFENIEVSYPAGMFGDDQTDFRERLSDFRNAIMAQKGYQRLSDTYHPDEYRMGIYVDGLEVEPTHYDEAGQFTLKFNCKPQRWLTSGEEPIDVMAWGETETLSGEIVTFEAEDETIGIKSVSADINPIQDLHGYDKPWAGGNGKNKLPYGTTATVSGVVFTVASDGVVTLSGSSASAENQFSIPFTVTSTGDYYFNGCSDGGGNNTFDVYVWDVTNGSRAKKWDGTTNSSSLIDSSSDGQVRLVVGTSYQYRIRIRNGFTPSGQKFYPMIRLSTESAAYEPYSNICPISGWDDETIYVSPTEDEEDATTFVIDLGGTRYGGTIDVTSGAMNVTHEKVLLSSAWTWNSNSYDGYTVYNKLANTENYADGISDSFKVLKNGDSTDDAGIIIGLSNKHIYVIHANDIDGVSDAESFKTWLSNNPTYVTLPITPLTVQLTPTQIEALVGENNIWADTGNVTVEYGQAPGYITNPTLFDAQPVLAVEGYGEIGFNDYVVALTDVPIGDVNIRQGEDYSGSPAFSLVEITRQIDTNLLLSGDAITIGYLYSRASLQRKSTQYSNYSGSVSTVDAGATAECDSHGFSRRVQISDPIELEYGTPSSASYTATFSLSWKYNGTTTTGSATLQLSYEYDGDATIVFRSNHSAGLSSSAYNVVGRYIGYSDITAFSTKSALGHPTIIDCEIGEAYMLEGGEIVSLNRYIDLGSDLPVLAPGANEITYSDTITELEVKPNWWKV